MASKHPLLTKILPPEMLEDIPAPGWDVFDVPARAKIARERHEKRAAYDEMDRLMDDFHSMRRKHDAAYKALEDAHHETLFRLALASAFKEGKTGVHIVRIGTLAALLAHSLEQSIDFCQQLLRAAPLYDVGKISVSDKILNKSGSLSQDEKQHLRSHTEIGAQILGGSGIPVLKVAAEIALHHHERWDGHGYPYRLQGGQIPYAARIVSLVEYFDRMSHREGPREALTNERVLHRIERGAGRIFDPHMVEVFVKSAPRMIAARDFIDRQGLGADGVSLESDWWMVF